MLHHRKTSPKFVSTLPSFHTDNKHGLPTAHKRTKRGNSTGRIQLWMIVVSLVLVILYVTSFSTTKTVPQHRALTEMAAYDLVVAGAGPAGLTAALFGARSGLSVLVMGSSAGQLSETSALDNFPSFTSETGGEGWLLATKQQAADAGVHFAQAGLLISRIQQHDNIFSLAVAPENYNVTTRSVIIATGATGKKLQLPHEESLWGKAVHSCAICDGSSYTDKTVVVVGGGDAAVDAAILLSRHATRVILVHRRTQFRASNQANLQTLKALPNVQIKMPFVVTRYETTQERLTGVTVEHIETQRTERIACNGVFVMIGSSPNTDFVRDTLRLEANGLVKVDGTTATSVQGIFAAGEVTDARYKQAITAAAAGAQAAIDAERWLRRTGVTVSQGRLLPDGVPLQIVQVKSKEVERKESVQQAPTEDCDLTKEECITTIVSKYPVVVFSKPWCPFCRKALEALAIEGVKGEPYLHVVDLGAMDNSQAKAIQNTLQRITGRRTVPNVFVGGTSIGGGDETTAMHRSGKLRPLLQQAKALSDDVSCDLTQEDCITSVVHRYPVVVFSKPYCPYCRRALEALGIEGIKDEPYLHVVDLTAMENGSAVQDTLQKMTGRRTVPNVFVGGKSIGGGDETTGLHQSGKLRPLLEQAKALG